MNPDTGDEAEDWFAKFEREAREAALKREQEQAGDQVPPAETPATPQLPNPFAAPAAPAAPEPTQAMPVVPEPTQAMPAQPEPASRPEEPTQALEAAPLRPPGDEGPTALDALFGDDRFREYDSTLGPDPSNAPFANRARAQELVHVPGAPVPPPPQRFGRPQKILAGVGAGLAAIIALIGLFVLGTRLPDLLGPAPAVAPSPSATPTPTLTALPVGPVGPGVWAWDELLGGECLEPYDAEQGAWAEEYTVVDCAEPHGAQLVSRAWFPPLVVDPENPQVGKPDDPFPGLEALQAQMSLLCSAPGVIDYAAAGAYSDAQVQGSYPVTEEQWEKDPSYYCFVSRSSGEPMTGSVAAPRPEAQPAP